MDDTQSEAAQADGKSKALADLYKRSTEILGKNKTLSLLRKLYEISVLTLEPRELAERISQTVRIDLSFELVGIFLYDQPSETLSPLSFSSSERMLAVQEQFKTYFAQIAIPLSHSEFLKKAVVEKCMESTENLDEVWDELVPAEIFAEIRKDAHVKSSVAYPLISGNAVIGVLLFSLNRLYSELLDHEKESIESFIDVVAVALDKALLDQGLKIANEQQSNLIHFITHQVKGFLATSRNIFANIMEGDYGPASEEIKAIAKEGLESGTKGVTTVQDILNASNIKKGTVSYAMSPLDLRAIIEEKFADLKPAALAKKLRYELKVGEGSYEIPGDAGQLKQALKNLIDNSIKYTNQGSVEATLEKKPGGKILFSLRDTGVGINDEDKKRLFTEGGHGKDSIRVNVDSTGYGLFIVKGIIEAHKGRVWAESEGEGKGSAFFIELQGK